MDGWFGCCGGPVSTSNAHKLAHRSKEHDSGSQRHHCLADVRRKPNAKRHGQLLLCSLSRNRPVPGLLKRRTHSMTDAQKSQLISDMRLVAKAIMADLNTYRALRREYDAFDAGNVLVDGDFTGLNSQITKTQFVNGVAALGTVDGAAEPIKTS